jgi:hypothetical protein
MTKENLSIITTFYNNDDSANIFFQKIEKVFVDLKKIYLIEKISLIIVNDGSEISQYNFLKEKIFNSKLKIKLISHNQNYGQHNAIITGLSSVNAEYVCLINFDLDEDPNYIFDLYKLIQEDKKIESVVCCQKFQFNSLKNIFSSFFWKLYNLKKKNHFYFLHRPRTLRIIRKDIVDQIVEHSTNDPFFEGIFRDVVNFHYVKAIEINIKQSGTRYNFFSKLRLFINAFYNLNRFFLNIYLSILIIMSCASFILGLVYFFKYIFFYNSNVISGFPSLIISIWFLGSIIIAGISFIIHILIDIKTKTNKKTINKIDEN